MVKNLSTIDRSERVRIGKHVPNEQAVNTIIINASSNVIEASQEGFYLAPIRVNEAMNSNAMCYDITTNEVVDSGTPLTLQGLTFEGNSTTETVQFTNNTTGFVTTSNVGIANTNPQHELSVGGDVYVEGNLTVVGETTAISSENLRVKDAIVELGENNTDNDFVFDLGLIMTRPGSNVTASYIESSNEYIIGYTQNSASDTYITPDASNLIQMRVYGDVTANSFIGDGSFLSNVIQDTDLDANLTVIRDEMAANTLTLRDDIQSNANVLRGEMAANTLTLRDDIQSNANVLRGEMAANTVTLRDDIQSNANVLRGEMAANTVTLRADLQSNIAISQNTMRSEMTANTLALRDDLQSNITISQNTMRSEMTANTLALRSDLQSNVTALRGEMAANTVTLRNDLQSNVTILRGEMVANTVALRSDLQSNVTTLRGEMAANTVTLRNEIALKSNINNPVFTGIITGDGGAISNISLQHVTEYGNSTDQTITMSNALSLITSGSVGINTPTPQKMLHVAGEILADDDITGVDFYGDDATFTGGLTVSGNSLFYGNLEVRGNTTYLSTQNLLVEDPILALGANNTSSSLDTGLIVLVYQGDSNVAFGYRGASNEFIISHTLSAPDDSELIPDTSNVINVHVYGNVTADKYIGDGTTLTGIALETDMISNVSRISVLETDMSSNASRVGVLETDMSSNASRVSVLETDMSSNASRVGVLETDMSSNAGRVSVLETDLSSNASRVSVLETDMSSNAGRVSVLETDLSSNASRVGVLETDLSSNAGRVSVLETDLSSNASRVGVLETDLSSNAGRVSVLETDLSSNASRVGVLETDMSSNAGRVSVLETDLSSNASRVSVLETDLSSNAIRIGVLEQQGLSDIVNIGNVSSNTIQLTNADVGLKATGNVEAARFIGDGSHLTGLVTTLQDVADNGNVSSNTIQLTNADVGLKATGNVEAARFIGDGSHLTGLVTTLQDVADNGNVSSNTIQLTNADVGLKATGNVEAARFIGDGSHLTGLVTTLQDVADNGNVSSNTIQLTNADVGLKATGNVEAARFIGDGSHLTGLVTTLQDVADNGNVSSNTIQLTNADVGLKATGNVEAARFIGDGSHLTGLVTDLQSVVDNGNVSSNTIQLTNADVGLKATGNVEAARFIGDGSSLTGISFASNLEDIVLGGNVTSQTIHIQNAVSLTTTGNVGIANTNPMCDLAVGSNVCVNDISSNILTVDGNILAHKLTLDSIQITGGIPLQSVTYYGNTTSNTVEFTNPVTGLVTTANVGIANSNPIHTLDVGSNLWVEDTGSNVLYVNGNVHVAGSQLSTNGNVGIGNTAPDHNLSVGSNLYVEDTGSNVLVIDGNASINSTLFLGAVEISPAYTLEEVTGQGNVTSNVIQFTNADVGLVATGNVEAARFIGDGSHLTGLVTDLQSVVDNGNVSSNVVQFTNANVGAVFTGGIVINDGSYKCKHYAYSNVSVPTNFANVAMTFASNVFHAKITAQLTHGNEEVSTMTLDVQGGTRDGTTSSLNIASGPGSVFGHNNTKPWSMSVGTTPTKVILEPSSTGTSAYGVDVYIEYKSSSTEGKLESISIGADTVKSFVY